MRARSLRILHVVPSYLPAWRYGGPIRSVHGLAKAQVESGDRVEAFTTDADGPGRLAVPNDRRVDVDGVGVWYFRCGWPRRLYRSTPLRRALVRRMTEFDVVHLHSVFLWPTLVAAREAERLGVPYFVSPRGMLVESLISRRGSLRKQAWIRLFERRTLARAAGTVVQSELELRELESLGLALSAGHVIPNGFDFEEVESADGSSAPRWLEDVIETPYVLFLGRLSWKKGIGRLIDALPLVEGVDLVVAGNDEEGLTPALKRQAAELGVAHRVAFVGEVRGPTKWTLLRNAKAFCLPSSSENFGIAAVEAMAVGTPTIVSPDVGIASIEGLRSSLVVTESDRDALSRSIRWTLEEGPAVLELRDAARTSVRRELCWSKIAGDLRAVYGRSLAKG